MKRATILAALLPAISAVTAYAQAGDPLVGDWQTFDGMPVTITAEAQAGVFRIAFPDEHDDDGFLLVRAGGLYAIHFAGWGSLLVSVGLSGNRRLLIIAAEGVTGEVNLVLRRP